MGMPDVSLTVKAITLGRKSRCILHLKRDRGNIGGPKPGPHPPHRYKLNRHWSGSDTMS